MVAGFISHSVFALPQGLKPAIRMKLVIAVVNRCATKKSATEAKALTSSTWLTRP
jgi:hypothetical protein